jgi:hypothetical protein
VRLPRLLAGGAVAAVLTGTAACGLPAVEPKLELRDALSAFAAGRSGTLELSIPSSADDVRAFDAAADPSGGDAGTTDDVLQQLLSSSVEMGYDFGEDRDSDADDSSRVVVHLDGLDAGELRLVDGLLYARVDVEGLGEKFPEMQPDLDSLRAGLTGEDGAPAPMIEAGTAILDGGWVSVDVQAYLDQLAAAGTAPGDPTTGSSESSSAALRDLLGDALKGAVASVERREADGELGDHLVAGLDLRKVYATLRSGLPEVLTGGTADALEQQLPPVAEVPDKQIDVSFWVRDGDLTRVELDIAQFLDEPAGHLVLRADVLAPEEITAPSDAIEFDIAALMEAGMSGYPPGGEGRPSAELEPDAYTVATWIDMDLADRAYEEGGQPSVEYLAEMLPYYEGIAKSLDITAVGERIQVTLDKESVCLTLSPDGMGEDIAEGPC